ncbi:unnamed protein product [Protopolystoma xenopodis]|uniref:Uncharacterized protein n=1 Tax=Protopolystoma xenopodis TaxID=117903 RepID=A0A3S4ZBL2_9PLAT|nr:unnamed protein product [Protopolystoma xenopodis]
MEEYLPTLSATQADQHAAEEEEMDVQLRDFLDSILAEIAVYTHRSRCVKFTDIHSLEGIFSGFWNLSLVNQFGARASEQTAATRNESYLLQTQYGKTFGSVDVDRIRVSNTTTAGVKEDILAVRRVGSFTEHETNHKIIEPLEMPCLVD